MQTSLCGEARFTMRRGPATCHQESFESWSRLPPRCLAKQSSRAAHRLMSNTRMSMVKAATSSKSSQHTVRLENHALGAAGRLSAILGRIVAPISVPGASAKKASFAAQFGGRRQSVLLFRLTRKTRSTRRRWPGLACLQLSPAPQRTPLLPRKY